MFDLLRYWACHHEPPSPPTFFPPLRWWRTAFKASCYSLIFGNNAPNMCASWLSLRFAKKKVSFMIGLIQLLPHPSSTHAWDLWRFTCILRGLTGTKTTVPSIGRSNMGACWFWAMPLWTQSHEAFHVAGPSAPMSDWECCAVTCYKYVTIYNHPGLLQ